MATKIPNYRKINQTAMKIYQHLAFKDCKKFTQIRTIGLKMYHLATLAYIVEF
jgi:hypothetical protein